MNIYYLNQAIDMLENMHYFDHNKRKKVIIFIKDYMYSIITRQKLDYSEKAKKEILDILNEIVQANQNNNEAFKRAYDELIIMSKNLVDLKMM